MYTRKGDRITLEMTRDDFEQLLIMLGYAAAAAIKAGDLGLLRDWIRLANEVNNGNPDFTPYELPPAEPGERGGSSTPQDSAAVRWRTGRKVKLNVYYGERPVCQCHSEEDAARIVCAMNAADDAWIAHRWFAKRFGEVMNGRDFAVKCEMADHFLQEERNK